jgi:transposase
VLNAADLPDDIDTLKRLVIDSQTKLAERDYEIEHLKLLIAKLRRLQYGRSSEKLDAKIGQLELLVEELEANRAADSARAAHVPASNATHQQRPARRPLPEHLPRETVEYAPACTCPACGSAMQRIGEDVAEVVEYVPESFKVIRQLRPKLACTGCQRIVQLPAPSRPIARGLAGPGLLAHILVAKYADHLPLYRQSQIYARQGLGLEPSILADCVGGAAALLEPLVAALARYTLSTPYLHGDDTPVPVLEPGRGKTKTGRLWTYVRDGRPWAEAAAPAVLFRYSPDRKGEHPQSHLKRFSGILQADGYAGFDRLYDGAQISEAACWAHVRRKFYDLHESNGSPLAAEALAKIAKLYEIEAAIRGRPPDERRALRGARAGALLEDMRAWLEATLAKVSAKSAFAGALRGGAGPQELPVRRVGCRRRACRGDLQLDRHGQAQRPRPRGLPARGAHAHRRASDQSRGRVAALGHGRGSQSRRPHRRLI